MAATLLWIDALLNLGMGALLAWFPRGLVTWLGLPYARPYFYARVLGAVLFGIGLALVVAAWRSESGLGLMGAVAINLSGAAMLVALLMMTSEVSGRGRVVLWGAVAVLAGLSIAELGVA